jgi:F-type H+-transporting ATPase subunit gamma
MPGLKEVRIRIASVKSTQQITNAMRMVAASKLRRAQNAILKLRPYAAKLREIMENLSSSLADTAENLYAEDRPQERILLVVLTSNRGLCGAFNANIIRETINLMNGPFADQNRRKNVSLITVGRKATEYFRKRNYPVADSWDEIYDHLVFEQVAPLAGQLMSAFTSRQYDRIILIYNQFKNAAVQRLVQEQFLPILPETPPKSESGLKKETNYLFEPDRETILQELVPKSLRIQFHKALLDSFASEQGARMTAMQKATDNARELLRNLQISYNKARQNAITKELLEIVAGAEALKG